MQEITTREKLFALLGFFILLFSLPLAILVVRQKVTYRGRAVGPVAAPVNVRVTNVHSAGFTVSWITDIPTNGSIFNGSSEIQDVRGAADTYNTHYVDVLGLSPDTDYSIKIKSGPDIYAYTQAAGWYKELGTPGNGMTVRTAKQIGNEAQDPSASNPYGAYSTEPHAFDPCPDGTLTPGPSPSPNLNSACFRPYPLWGEVKNPSGQAVAGALVYAVINKDSTLDSPNVLSAITDSAGRWSLDLANQYTTDLRNYLAYNPSPSGDKILVAAYSDQGSVVMPPQNMVSVLSTTCTNPPTTCEMNAPSPVMLTLTPTSGSPTPTASAGATATPGPTATVVPTATPAGISFAINKILLQGRSDNTMAYTVKFRAANSSNTSPVLTMVNASVNASGISSTISVPGLSSGNYDVYAVPNESYLSAKQINVSFEGAGTKTIDFTNGATHGNDALCGGGQKLCAGDIKSLTEGSPDMVYVLDYDRVLSNFGKQRSELPANLKEADFDNNGEVWIYDYNFALSNFNKKGADKE